ncbi:hypothetical protein V6R21_30980 [Limibacter armeniacum]|uniref:hypothetical protein n=1 Tax=Limibacter armeniacum TaxID=466084 RepID=UPI002FE6A8CE
MPIIVTSHKFCQWLRIAGITLYPFIIVKTKELKVNPVLINHELIHIRQQQELLVIPFYLLYLGHYLYNLYKYKDAYIAYRNICFEREAYEMEWDLQYLKRRRMWTFWRYW